MSRSMHMFLQLLLKSLLFLGLIGWVYPQMALLGDSFWSIATGRWIIENGRLPTVDPFSYTAETPWIVHMPLGMLLIGAIEMLVGVLGLELIFTIIFSTSLILLSWPHAKTLKAQLLSWPFLLSLAWLQFPDLCVRAQVLGDLMFACLLFLCLKLNGSCSVKRFWLWGIPLGCAWVLLHSSFLLGIVLPLILGAILLSLRRQGSRSFFLLSACITLGSLINPYGYKLPLDIIELFLSADTQSIDLFSAPDYLSPQFVCGVLLGLFPISLAWRLKQISNHRVELILLIFLLIAATLGRRYLVLSGGLGCVLISRILNNDFRFPEHYLKALGAVLACVGSSLFIWGIAQEKNPWRDAPVASALSIDQLALPGPIANIYHFGGFLDYHWAGRKKVWIDGRNQLFEGAIFQAAHRLNQAEDVENILDTYKINTIVWESGGRLDHYLTTNDAWKLIQRNYVGVVYVRESALKSMNRF